MSNCTRSSRSPTHASAASLYAYVMACRCEAKIHSRLLVTNITVKSSDHAVNQLRPIQGTTYTPGKHTRIHAPVSAQRRNMSCWPVLPSSPVASACSSWSKNQNPTTTWSTKSDHALCRQRVCDDDNNVTQAHSTRKAQCKRA